MPTLIFCVTELQDIRNEILKEICADFTFYHSAAGSDLNNNDVFSMKDSISLDNELEKCSTEPEPLHISKSISILDSLLYMYTSGTTGLPKAVDMTHLRYVSEQDQTKPTNQGLCKL
jgi:acyl-coenzyme A synthetase/AMP-(fatty) acid ligase